MDERRRIATAAIAVLLAGAALLATLAPGGDRTATPGSDPGVASTDLDATRRRSRPGAERAARAFVLEYIRFTRRRLPARRMRSAAPRVRRQLARMPFGRGTPAVREHPLRPAGAEVVAAEGRSVRVRALVSRLGVRRPLDLTLGRRAGRWIVVAVDLHAD